LYSNEAGHEVVRATRDLVISVLARAEVPSAIWRKVRLDELAHTDAAILVAAFESDYYDAPGGAATFATVAAVDEVLADAARLTASLGLRAFDAIQLASALAARNVDQSCSTFLCFDESLRRAAASSGFSVVPAIT
jgi:predicted nucleic acid-binding protein